MAISTGQVEAVLPSSLSGLAFSRSLFRPPAPTLSLRAPTMRLAGSFPQQLFGFEWLSLEARLNSGQRRFVNNHLIVTSTNIRQRERDHQRSPEEKPAKQNHQRDNSERERAPKRREGGGGRRSKGWCLQ